MSAHEEDSDDLIEPPPQQDSDLQDVLTETGLASVRTLHEVLFKQDTIFDFEVWILWRLISA